jgi:hypothetical protein
MALALTTVLPTFTAVPAFTLVLGVGTGGEVATSETLSGPGRLTLAGVSCKEPGSAAPAQTLP